MSKDDRSQFDQQMDTNREIRSALLQYFTKGDPDPKAWDIDTLMELMRDVDRAELGRQKLKTDEKSADADRRLIQMSIEMQRRATENPFRRKDGADGKLIAPAILDTVEIKDTELEAVGGKNESFNELSARVGAEIEQSYRDGAEEE